MSFYASDYVSNYDPVASENQLLSTGQRFIRSMRYSGFQNPGPEAIKEILRFYAADLVQSLPSSNVTSEVKLGCYMPPTYLAEPGTLLRHM